MKNLKKTECWPRAVFVAFIVGASILSGTGCSKEDENQYAIIDLSSGPNAQTYPVTWLKTIPEGGWTDEHKTTKLVLRKISPGTFKMGSSEDEQGRDKNGKTEKRHTVTLTRSFYMGVFEVTQKQWELVMGTRPSAFCREKWYAMRPVERISYDMIRGGSDGAQWPLSAAVDADSFIGKLRSRTKLVGLDLPTEAQWEYACRGSATNSALGCGINLKRIVKDGEVTSEYKLNNFLTNVSDVIRCDAKDIKKPELKGLGSVFSVFVMERAGVMGDPGVYGVNNGTAEVGSYPCNSLGLYDMNGNVCEWCLDAWSIYPEDMVTDPLGDDQCYIDVRRVLRGGCWGLGVECCRSASRTFNNPECGNDGDGLRICYMPEPYKSSIPVVNNDSVKKIAKIRGITLGEKLPSGLKEDMKYNEYEFMSPKPCVYTAYEDALSSDSKSLFLKPEWLLHVEIKVVPGSKEAYKIIVKYDAEDEDEAKAKADALAAIVQEDLGIVMAGRDHVYSYGVKNNWCRISPSIHLTLSSDGSGRKTGARQCVCVEFCDESLIADLKAEAEGQCEKLPRTLAFILGIRPVEQQDGKVEKIDGFFGKMFGEKVDSTVKNNVGAVTRNFDVPGLPLGFKEGVVFGTPKSHQTFMIRAVFAQADIKGAYNAAKKLIEDVTGLEMKKGRGKTHLCRPKTSRGECMIEVIENDAGDHVFIDVTDLKLYELLEDERNVDEFGFIPRVKKGQAPKEILGVFGKELGCSVADMETETNDNNALVASFIPDENEFGFDAFRLFATPKTKKTFMIRAGYTGLDVDGKFAELIMKLEKILGTSPSIDDDGNRFFIKPGAKNLVFIQVIKNGDVLLFDVTDTGFHSQYEEEKK